MELTRQQYAMSDLLRHELGRRGFFTCSMIIQSNSFDWPLEDWTGGRRKGRINSLHGFKHNAGTIKFQSDAELLAALDGIGWKPLDKSPVPDWYFPYPPTLQPTPDAQTH